MIDKNCSLIGFYFQRACCKCHINNIKIRFPHVNSIFTNSRFQASTSTYLNCYVYYFYFNTFVTGTIQFNYLYLACYNKKQLKKCNSNFSNCYHIACESQLLEIILISVFDHMCDNFYNPHGKSQAGWMRFSFDLYRKSPFVNLLNIIEEIYILMMKMLNMTDYYNFLY